MTPSVSCSKRYEALIFVLPSNRVHTVVTSYIYWVCVLWLMYCRDISLLGPMGGSEESHPQHRCKDTRLLKYYNTPAALHTLNRFNFLLYPLTPSLLHTSYIHDYFINVCTYNVLVHTLKKPTCTLH